MEGRLTVIPRHETLQVGILLALVGGFLDAYTYLLRGKVFANAQTGNIVLFGLNLAQKKWGQAGYYVLPILAFFLGVLLTEWVKRKFSQDGFFMWEHIILLLEILLLVLVGFCPTTVPHGLVNVTVSFVCSVQVNSFRKVHSISYASTMCTGNLRSAAENFFLFLTQKDKKAGRKCGGYFIIIGSFTAGAVTGALASSVWQERAVWACCFLLLGAFALMLKKGMWESSSL